MDLHLTSITPCVIIKMVHCMVWQPHLNNESQETLNRNGFKV
jgi:hypothetical protein